MGLTKEQKKKKRERNFLYDFIKWTGIWSALIWLRPKVLYAGEKATRDVKGGAIIAANHITFIDPITIHCVFWRRRMYSLATKDIADTPIKEKFFRAMHCVLIDKENFTVGSLRAVCDLLKEGKLLSIFPEGSVNVKDGEVQSYKSGAVLMSHLSGRPIIPIYMVKPQHWYSRRYIVVGEAVDVRELCGKIPSVEEISKVNDYLQEKEVKLMEIYQKYKQEK